MKVRKSVISFLFGLFLSVFAMAQVLAAPVNVNTADAATLAKSLRGVGPKIAERIVSYRKQYGPFKAPEDLMKVKGIGLKTLERNKKDILVGKQTKSAKSASKAEKPKK